MESTVERKYALIRIQAGDYLLPGNDGKMMFRIASYTDGPTNGLDIPRDRKFWGCWEWAERPEMLRTVDDPTDWGHWEQIEGLCETRQQAIDSALRYSPEPERSHLLARASDEWES